MAAVKSVIDGSIGDADAHNCRGLDHCHGSHRDKYEVGADELSERHLNVFNMLCDEAPD